MIIHTNRRPLKLSLILLLESDVILRERTVVAIPVVDTHGDITDCVAPAEARAEGHSSYEMSELGAAGTHVYYKWPRFRDPELEFTHWPGQNWFAHFLEV